MNSNLFLVFSYITYGFSIVPFLLICFFYFKKNDINPILALISSVEFLVGTFSILLNIYGFGYIQEQYVIYNIIGIALWSFLLLKINSNKILNYIFFSLLIIITLLSIYYQSNRMIEFTSTILQFIFGIILLSKSLQKIEYHKEKVFFSASIGILVYSFTVTNFFIFKSEIVKCDISDFSKLWMVHQVASIVYYMLLTISIWKSQKI
jgi:hypothetical protein